MTHKRIEWCQRSLVLCCQQTTAGVGKCGRRTKEST